jgi:hypothetical protein
MSHSRRFWAKRWSRFGCLLLLSVVFWCGLQTSTWAQGLMATRQGALQERLANYPHWTTLPPLSQRKGEINYPEWFAGTWHVTSTLVEQLAPLAPDIVSPGFEQNESYLHRPIAFTVKFDTKTAFPEFTWALSDLVQAPSVVLPDRRFNAEAITTAYLGDDLKFSVQVTLQPLPRVVTVFDHGKRLTSTAIGHNQQAPSESEFIATELSTQQFINGDAQYLNQVETTTDYQQLDNGTITATQITAVYLSPQDPDYFNAQNRPIALYRYQLILEPEVSSGE